MRPPTMIRPVRLLALDAGRAKHAEPVAVGLPLSAIAVDRGWGTRTAASAGHRGIDWHECQPGTEWNRSPCMRAEWADLQWGLEPLREDYRQQPQQQGQWQHRTPHRQLDSRAPCCALVRPPRCQVHALAALQWGSGSAEAGLVVKSPVPDVHGASPAPPRPNRQPYQFLCRISIVW